MYNVTEKRRNKAMANIKGAANKIERWKAIAKEARWHHFEEVRSVFKDADEGDGPSSLTPATIGIGWSP
jgi:HigB_toxin, RelE-like toxic component of a toxin-antitoxin system